MNFEWGDEKSNACYRMRGFDFAYAAFAFADPHRIVRQDRRFSYGEARYDVLRRIEGRLYVLIYTPRRNGVRLVSARKANRREVKRYENRSSDD